MNRKRYLLKKTDSEINISLFTACVRSEMRTGLIYRENNSFAKFDRTKVEAENSSFLYLENKFKKVPFSQVGGLTGGTSGA